MFSTPAAQSGASRIRARMHLRLCTRRRNCIPHAISGWAIIASLNADSIRKLFEQVRAGKLSPDDAVARLRHLPFEDLGFAKVDHHRALRVGMPEVIFGQGKTPVQVAGIFERLARHKTNVLATRASREQFLAVKKKIRRAAYPEEARAIVLEQDNGAGFFPVFGSPGLLLDRKSTRLNSTPQINSYSAFFF